MVQHEDGIGRISGVASTWYDDGNEVVKKGRCRMENLKVLIADDDPNVSEIIRLYFDQLNIELLEARDGEQAVQLTETEAPDVVILDIMMPKMDGYEACRHIRQKTDVPIIMLTAKGEEFDRVLGLELGADDYVTKPFSPREIVARIKAILRRMPQAGAKEQSGDAHIPQTLRAGEITVHVDRREVVVKGERIPFRPKEFDLLTYFIQHPEVVLTREQLLKQVWGYDYFGDIRTVDVHVKKIRQKLQAFGIEYIHTVWGVGYRFQHVSAAEEGV